MRSESKTILSLTLVLLFAAGIAATATSSRRCNEALCGSIISKCLLTKECDCRIEDCFCCEECSHCLGELYNECCPCLGLCPLFENNKNSSNSKTNEEKSETRTLDGIPDLFEALTVGPANDLWMPFTFPRMESKKEDPDPVQDNNLEKAEHSEQCTVVYLHTCLTWNKCINYCESMGASSCRWFYDGCCECIGFGCSADATTGKKCSNCPEREDHDDFDYSDQNSWDYGEDDND